MRVFAVLFLLLSILTEAGCAHYYPPSTTTSLSWRTIIQRTANYYAPQAEQRLVSYFQQAQVSYPPKNVALLIFKKEKKMEVWAHDNGPWKLIKTYQVLAASGGPGPKLHEGDRQVPEGIYRIVNLNPHSRFHLSLDLSYPNNFDRQQARFDGRHDLGSDIYIHGNNKSIGCIAMGDKAIEELFVLVYKTSLSNVAVIIAPNDLRVAPPAQSTTEHVSWLPVLYQNLATNLQIFKNNNLTLTRSSGTQ